jgi:hypothetical protein
MTNDGSTSAAATALIYITRLRGEEWMASGCETVADEFCVKLRTSLNGAPDEGRMSQDRPILFGDGIQAHVMFSFAFSKKETKATASRFACVGAVLQHVSTWAHVW